MSNSKANLQTAAIQAGLNDQQRGQVDGLTKLLDSHRKLLATPQPQAEQAFNSLPKDQQAAHVALFGGDSGPVGWLGSAAHYVGQGVKEGVSRTFGALNEVSDFMTRLYRTGAIALDQKVDLSKAFQIANDKGDKVFSPSRIADAKLKYGKDMTSVAMKVAEGQTLDAILATGTDEEKQIASIAAQKKDPLFQDALDAVNAAKYSPGRQLANLLLPESLEGSGLLYKGISGIADASYRVFADPTLALGKAKKSYDAANYALFKIVGQVEKVDEVFAKPAVRNFFDAYGAELDNLAKARKANDTKAMVTAAVSLKRLAPEFGPAAVDEFIKAGVKNADTAKNYLANHVDVKKILTGQSARKTPLIPRLDPARKARVAFLTGADKVFNIDKVGQKLVDGLYGTRPTVEKIANTLNEAEVARAAGVEALTGQPVVSKIAEAERQVGKLKQDGSFRLSLGQIGGKIDRFAAKFATIPYFKDGFFDVTANDAVDQVYRLARLTNTRYHSKVIAQAFAAGSEGQRKSIFTGLWNTIAETRGLSKMEAGQTYMNEFAGKGLNKQYSADILKYDEAGNPVRYNPSDIAGEQMALFPYQLNSAMAVPSIIDMDRLSARSGLIGRIVGISHKKWAEKMTAGWVIGTLAGPRFPVRNAAEDMMIHLAIGDSPWGIVKGRFLSTKLRETGVTGDLGFLNKLLLNKNAKRYQAEMRTAMDNGDVDAARKVMAMAVLEHGLPRTLDAEGSDILAEIAKYGNLDDTLRDVSEGSKNALRAGDVYLNTSNDVAQFGKMGAIEIDGVRYKQSVGDKGFTQYAPAANKQNMISWLVSLGITSNDDLAKIAVLHLDNKEQAIKNMVEFLSKLTPAERGRFSLYSNGETVTTHAQRAYDAVANLYSKADGTINDDLLKKVRKVDADGKTFVSTADLGLKDLPNDLVNTPRLIHGPTLVPVNDSDNVVANLMDKAWDGMGEANARFSREPIVIDAMISIRKDMKASGYEKHYMDMMTSGLTGDALKEAEDAAKRHLVGIAEDMAKNRVLAYVDNPAVRSQLALSVRNFARFYRATEDFYRRLSRTVRYNPEALTRASLTYEGIAHSGFVQTDDSGDQYFFYPGLTPVYKVMNKVMRLFGVKDAFQTPMPVEFGGSLKMITPSMNPDSLFPTFAGPLAAVPMKMIGNVIPQVADLEQYFLGAYGQDQPMISSVLPAHLNRLLQSMNTDERSSQYASAARKAATYLEASGHGLEIKIDPATGEEIPPSAGEIAKYQDKLQASTMTILALRFAFGFVAPASPSVTLKSDMAQWVRDNGRTNYKQVFNNLINQYNGDIDKASQEWIKLFPDQMPYTVSESESTVVANVRAVDTATNWIKNNKELLAKYPEAAAFLIPQAGNFDFNSYKLLMSQGLKTNKTLTDFVAQVSSAKDIQTYYNKKDEYDQQMAMTFSTDAKRQLRDQWQTWSDQFKGARPLLQQELGAGSQKAVARVGALNDLRLMLTEKKSVANTPVGSLLKQMLDTYDSYVNQRDLVSQPGMGYSQDYKDTLKLNAQSTIQAIAGTDPNALAAFNSLFAPLFR